MEAWNKAGDTEQPGIELEATSHDKHDEEPGILTIVLNYYLTGTRKRVAP